MTESDCCGAEPLWNTDICSDCREHAEFNEYEDTCAHCDAEDVSYKGYCSKACYDYDLE